LANQELHALALQRRRLRTAEPEDEQFVLRWWADLQFFIVALRRFRRAVEIATAIPAIADETTIALRTFDLAVPSLSVMRNVGEHTEQYGVDSDRRHDKNINRRQLEVARWDGTTLFWLQDPAGAPHELNVDAALHAAEQLFVALPRTLS
jgi:hypothetical protein